MSKIILYVNDKHMSTVLTVLNSLKAGMINNIDTQDAKPVSSSLSSSSGGKYLSKDKYKNKLSKKQPVLEDEFLSKKNTSTGKYLNTASYKSKLKGRK